MILFPLLLMFFALGMERVEERLRRLSVRENEVEEFLDQASNSDVAALATNGFPHAFARFRRRRKTHQVPSTSPSDLGGASARQAS